MTKKRIQVYAEPETKRRIKLAAARHRIPVTKYCLNAIQQQLADDNLLEDEQTVASPPTGDKDDLIADLRALRERILARRDGQPIDIDIVERIRDERDEELLGMGGR